MGRKVEFDETIALDKAMLVFWRRGYQETSVKELLTAMEIFNGSFYHIYKDKKTLYLKVLDHYNKTIGGQRVAAFNQGKSYRESIRLFFKETIAAITNPDFAKGCLVVNSLVDVVMQDELLSAKVKLSLSNMESYLTEEIRNAACNNEIQVPDVGLIGEVMMTFLIGLLRTSNQGLAPTKLQAQVDFFLTQLGL